MKWEHGGKRTGAGRKRIGSSRNVYLTLPDDIWVEIDAEEGRTAEIIRNLLVAHYRKKSEKRNKKAREQMGHRTISSVLQGYGNICLTSILRRKK